MSTQRTLINHLHITTLYKELDKLKRVPGESARRKRSIIQATIDHYKLGYTEFQFVDRGETITVRFAPPAST